jgi:hypothetical protein
VLALRRRAWRALLLAAIPLAAALAAYLLYNRLLTGNALLQPFTVYNPDDRPKWPASFAVYWTTFSDYPLKRFFEMGWPWVPFCWLLVLPAFFRTAGPERRKAAFLFAGVALLFVGYGFYAADGGIAYGPRYAYEAIGCLAVLTGAALARFPRLGPNLSAVVLAVNLVLFATFTPAMTENIRDKTELYEAVRREGLRDAVVFLATGSGTAHEGDLTRNGFTFDAPVLYVRDHGAGNRELLEAWPGRKAYVYRWEEGSRRGRLEPWAP